MDTFEAFLSLEICAGRIFGAEPNPKARKACYVLDIDFGEAHGVKRSSAQLTGNYTPEDLIGSMIIAVLNFEPRRVAGVKSEVLVLALLCPDSGTVLVRPDRAVTLGARLA